MPKSPASATEMSENRGRLCVHSLHGANRAAPVTLVGAPLGLESLSPGRCDLAPGIVCAALRHMSVCDL